MTRTTPLLALVLCAAVGTWLHPSAVRADATTTPDGLQRPLVHAQLRLHDPGNPDKRTMKFVGEWSGSNDHMFNPAVATTVLRVRAEDGGDSGPLDLDGTKWKSKGRRGYVYEDKSGSVGGIRKIVLAMRKGGGGTLKVIAGSRRWAYTLGRPQGSLSVVLNIGSARWCAAFSGPYKKNDGKQVIAKAASAPATCPCADDTAGTWQAIQKGIFARNGCTDDACHGSAASGGLDLRPEQAYANLVDQPSEADPSVVRVKPGLRSGSMLWLKLAKSTLGGEYESVPKAGMPNGKAPITKDELEVVRLWIQAGAPETGVVPGTANLLASCLPPPEPLKIRPAPVPDPAVGVQFHAPPWQIPPRNAQGQNGEAEVCYATWYDFSAQIPDAAKTPCADFWGGPTRECFYWNHTELTQDPNSHHSIIHIYKGKYRDDIANPDAHFGPFQCLGGANAGQACDPKGPATQCPGGGCAGRVAGTVACFLYGPDDLLAVDKVTGANLPQVGGSQQPYLDRPFPDGVWGMYPTSGIMVWNSHAFNVTDQPATNEQYFNVFFAPQNDRLYPARGIFTQDFIFVQNVPPYERREYCATHTIPQGGKVFDLSSHTHKRGTLFRIWEPPNTPCTPGPGCQPDTTRDPLVVTTTYNDPTNYRYPAPKSFDDPDRASRTYKFCSVYDNGATDPTVVKRRSTSPNAIIGGKCDPATVECIANGPDDPRKGRRCGAGGQPDDSVCDSAPGAHDGVCDACPLKGGVTTEDEMYILLGTGYCAPNTSCEQQGELGGPYQK